MIGLYPDCPGSPYYTLTTPVFDKVTLHLDPQYYPKGDLVIRTIRSQAGDGLIQRMTLGGRPLHRYRISHDDLIQGRSLEIILK